MLLFLLLNPTEFTHDGGARLTELPDQIHHSVARSWAGRVSQDANSRLAAFRDFYSPRLPPRKRAA